MTTSECFDLISLAIALFWALILSSLIAGLIAFALSWITLRVNYAAGAR